MCGLVLASRSAQRRARSPWHGMHRIHTQLGCNLSGHKSRLRQGAEKMNMPPHCIKLNNTLALLFVQCLIVQLVLSMHATGVEASPQEIPVTRSPPIQP